MATLRELLLGYEKLVILKTIPRNNFDMSLSAKSLGISRQSLYRRIGKLKINLKELRELQREVKNGKG
jgi:transcriptional regulator with PAS, ATPase and Fis domain